MKRYLLVAPLALWLVAAVWLLVYVPCVEVMRDRAGHMEVRDAGLVNLRAVASAPGGDIFDHAAGADPSPWVVQVRYGLVAYREIALAGTVAALYGLLWLVLPSGWHRELAGMFRLR